MEKRSHDEDPTKSDEQLAVLSKNGDEEALGELIARYQRLIRSRARRYSVQGLETEDFVQEGSIAVLDAVRAYRPGEASFQTFAAKCIANRLGTVAVTYSRQKHLPLAQYTSIEDDPAAASEASNPETLVINREEYAGVKQKILSLLSPLEREVLVLYLAGCSYQEMARQLKRTPRTVDNALQRVRRKLKSLIV
ncbi:MAG: sigma-70 family RNA polymerase sigma factor [Oscillospiraceae bacterium]